MTDSDTKQFVLSTYSNLDVTAAANVIASRPSKDDPIPPSANVAIEFVDDIAQLLVANDDKCGRSGGTEVATMVRERFERRHLRRLKPATKVEADCSTKVRHNPQFTDRYQLIGWVFKTYSYIRRDQITRRVNLDIGTLPESEEPDDSDFKSLKGVRQFFESAIEDLEKENPCWAHVFRARTQDHPQTFPQIAQKLNISVDQAKRRFKQAVERLAGKCFRPIIDKVRTEVRDALFPDNE